MPASTPTLLTSKDKTPDADGSYFLATVGTESKITIRYGGVNYTAPNMSSCDAAITLPAGHTGPLLLKALGAAGVTYFNEMDPDNPATFGAGSSMLSVLPSVQAGSVYGINVITNLVAAAAGIDADAPVAPVATKIATAKALTLGVLGLTEADLGGDIFAAPVALKNKTDKSLTGIISGKMLYATVLAELAASSTGSPATQAATLFTKMKSAATSNTGAATNLSAISQVMLKAVSNISSGKSTALQSFGASGYEVPSALATSYTAAVTTATQAIKTQTNETIPRCFTSQFFLLYACESHATAE